MIRDLRRHAGGFTILETIIVLTVMIALLGSALLLFQQRVPRTQFAKSLNELTTQLTDVSNQVASGYYPNTNKYKCTGGAGSATIDSSHTSEQGQNEGCLFLGQAIKFGDRGCTNAGNECDKLRVYTVFGSRLSSSGIVAKSLGEAGARVSDDFGVQDYTNGYGLSVQKIISNATEQAGVAYLQSFGAGLSAGQPNGAPQVALYSVAGSVNDAYDDFRNNVSGGGLTLADNTGILLCVKSGTTNQYAFIILGAGGNAMSVEKQIVDQSTWGGKCL